ncbi:MAG: helix-turn-helix transcriptional regulator [Lachnospiraceae bacterium]|nr:helix-turn-helix transcriptional regulator [Lachnospiraceae bacterium]
MKLYKHTDGKCNASGRNIKLLREAAGLSQEQLAGKLQLAGLNLNQKAISRIETGDRVVPDFELIFFSEIFNVPVCKLLNTEQC